jgi:virginiamycin B lyase
MPLRWVSIAGAAMLLAGCAGGMKQPGQLVPGLSTPASGSLIVRVTLPAAREKKPDFISAATKGMSVIVAGPTNVKESVALTLGARGCKSSLMSAQCTLVIPGLKRCPTNANCYTASVATFDAFDAADNRIPGGAHELSADENFRFSIQSANTLIPLVLEGVPKSIAFLPKSNTQLLGTQARGFVEPKCGASAQDVSLVGVDADGNYIVGIGAPRMSLASSDPAQLRVVRPKISAPSIFTLEPPAAPSYPYGGYTIRLTASATPGASADTHAVKSIVKVAYSGAICGTISEFAVPTAGSQPYGITAGPDGNLWFTEFLGNKIGRITLRGDVTEFAVPTSSGGPSSIVTGPDRNLWFTEFAASKIARMTIAGSFSEYDTTTPSSEPVSIAPGPDRNMWFTEVGPGNVGKIATSGAGLTEYPVTGPGEPFGITSGPDGELWFTQAAGTGNIGEITTAGSAQEYPIPTSGSGPSDIVTGSDGALWFAECVGNKIGRITTDGVVTSEYPLPEAGSGPAYAILGADGSIWFSELNGNRIGGITTGGSFIEFAIPTVNSEPARVALGPDGAIWFAEAKGNKIGRLR